MRLESLCNFRQNGDAIFAILVCNFWYLYYARNNAVHEKIRAISLVSEESIIAARPEELVGIYAGDNHGYYVRCNYTYIDNPISAWDYIEQIKVYSQVKYAPFNVNGTGDLGYLYELDQRLATLFLEESVKKNPALSDIYYVREFLA